MAKLPPTKRFVAEDFPSQKSWIGNFFQGLNQFLETTIAALDAGLTLTDNLDAQVAQATVSTDSSGVITDNIVFKVTTRSRPTQLLIGKIELLSGTPPVVAIFPLWEYVPASNSIKISSVLGLPASSKFKLSFTIFTS